MVDAGRHKMLLDIHCIRVHLAFLKFIIILRHHIWHQSKSVRK